MGSAQQERWCRPQRFFYTIGRDPIFFQCEPVRGGHLSGFFFIKFGVYSVDSSKSVGNPPDVLNITRLFLKTQLVHLAVGSPYSVGMLLLQQISSRLETIHHGRVRS